MHGADQRAPGAQETDARVGLDAPFAVAITGRQDRFGSGRNVYFAYVLERSGRVALFESGPGGVNGWGHDDIIGFTPFRFRGARAIQPDPTVLTGGAWIAHRGQLDASGEVVQDGGAVSRLVLDHSITGVQPLVPGAPPSLRGIEFRVDLSVGRDVLGGVPLDLAFDDQQNLGALRGYSTSFSLGAPLVINSKSTVREDGGVIYPTNQPRYVFVPVLGVSDGLEVVRVLDYATGEAVDTNVFEDGVQGISVRGATVVASYFRQ